MLQHMHRSKKCDLKYGYRKHLLNKQKVFPETNFILLYYFHRENMSIIFFEKKGQSLSCVRNLDSSLFVAIHCAVTLIPKIHLSLQF
jgi:hypothetical protein